jgi:hypothetical protein
LSWQELTTSLVDSLVWPVLALAIAVLFRRAIGAALAGQLKRARFGPLEVEWDQKWEQKEAEAKERVPDEIEAQAEEDPVAGELVDELDEVARLSPTGAVLAAFARVEREVRRLAELSGVSGSRRSAVGRLIRQLDDVLDPQLRGALADVVGMRNLVAHPDSEGWEPSAEQAQQFVRLAAAVSYQLWRLADQRHSERLDAEEARRA